jgi:hypothetical protein
MYIENDEIDIDFLMEQIRGMLEESEEFFLFFNRMNPEDPEEKQHKKMVCMDEDSIFQMIHHLFAEDPGLFDRFIDFSEKQYENMESKPEENCGTLTEEEIETIYNNMIEKEKNENLDQEG